MQLNETIWGAPSTYKSVTRDSQYDKIKTPNITYSDVVAAHPELQFPYFEKSTYRWSVPSDSSIGHYSTCSWWAAAGTTSIKHEVKEPTPQGVVGLTFTANTSPSVATLSIRNAPYAENVDAVMKFPPYTKMAAQVTNQSGTVTYTGASTVNYSHKISYRNYANTWDGAFPIVSKLSYKESVICLYGSYLNEKGNYVNGNLVQSDVPAVFTGELDSLISNMRARYEADLAAEHNVEPEDYKLTGISAQYYLLNGNGTYRFTPANGCPYACAFSFYEPSQRWKLRYYDDPDLAATNLFTSSIGSGFMVGTGAARNTNPAVQSQNFGYSTYSSLPTPSTFFNGITTVWSGGEDKMSPCERSYRCSSKKQQFSDVSYHWEWRLRLQYESLKFEDVPTLPSSSSGKYSQIVLHPVLVIDSFNSSLGDYFAAVRRACLHEMAFLGLPMATNENAAMYELWTTTQTHIYIPQFDSHMVTTGQFLTLAESYTADPEGQYTWGNIYGDVEAINDYDPDYQPDPSGGNTPWEDNPYTEIQEGYWTGLGGLTYVSSMYDFAWAFEDVKQALRNDVDSAAAKAQNALQDFLDNPSLVSAQLYEAYQNTFKGVKDLNEAPFSKGYNTNYTDCFLSCIRYPFDISQYFEKATYSPGTMVWGTESVPNQGNPEDADIWTVKGYNTGYIVQGGELYVEKRFNNFLNYAPYTTAELYIPYCGSVPIDLEVFAGHTIKVKYLIDWFSGACIALIYRDNVVVDQIPGQIGTPIGIVAEDIQSYQNAMFNGSQTLKSQKAALRGSVVNGIGDMVDSIGGAAGTIATAMGSGSASNSGSMSASSAFTSGFNAGNDVYQHYLAKKTAQYNLDHTTIDFKQLGSNGPTVGSWNEQTCRLVLYYPTFLEGYNPQEYGHTVGFACLFNDKLENFSGLTVCASVDTSGLAGATEAEKNLIEDALKSGVYL